MDEGSRPPAEEYAAGETDENGHEDDSEEGGLLADVIVRNESRAEGDASARWRAMEAWLNPPISELPCPDGSTVGSLSGTMKVSSSSAAAGESGGGDGGGAGGGSEGKLVGSAAVIWRPSALSMTIVFSSWSDAFALPSSCAVSSCARGRRCCAGTAASMLRNDGSRAADHGMMAAFERHLN